MRIERLRLHLAAMCSRSTGCAHWPTQGEDPLLLRLAGADPLVSLFGAGTPGAVGAGTAGDCSSLVEIATHRRGDNVTVLY